MPLFVVTLAGYPAWQGVQSRMPLDDAVRGEALKRTLDAIEFAGEAYELVYAALGA